MRFSSDFDFQQRVLQSPFALRYVSFCIPGTERNGDLNKYTELEVFFL